MGEVEANTENSLEVGLRREEINGVVVCRRAWSRGFALLSHMELLAGGAGGAHLALYLEGRQVRWIKRWGMRTQPEPLLSFWSGSHLPAKGERAEKGHVKAPFRWWEMNTVGKT